MKKQIVNIINFIRGIEPREEVDLLLPVENQLRLLEKHQLPGTFLLQYDALIDNRFTTLLKNTNNPNIEIGLWFEIMRPLVEAAGLQWRGRKGFDWDWHANVGFSVGYTPAEREKVIDIMMERFRQEFGYYPKSVGSWLIDAYSLEYMAQKYDITASCNCKDQWGTDGYTLWGGYYGQAYYPSKQNAYTPAQTEKNQISVPIFKMLGSDPIYQYDIGLNVTGRPPEWQPVVTLEPVYSGASGGGGEPGWVDWYLQENFNGICVNFAYTQAGQENSFGWKSMEKGLTYQFELIAQLAQQNKLQVMTLGESGQWFKDHFVTTPPTAIAALSDWKVEDHKSIWFNSKKYRINLYTEGNRFWIRDWHIFDETYIERYLNTVCVEPFLVYDNLPVMDGNRWSGQNIQAGIYPVLTTGEAITFTQIEAEDHDNAITVKLVSINGIFTIVCKEDSVHISYPGNPFYLRFVSSSMVPVKDITEQSIQLLHNGHRYEIHVRKGICKNEDHLQICSDESGTISLSI